MDTILKTPKFIPTDEIVKNLSLTDAIVEVEKVFLAISEGKVLDSNLMHLDAEEGEYHVKGGIVKYATDDIYMGLKVNGRYVKNMEFHQIPNINGLIYLSDARFGTPLAILDSGYITRVRTGAATAVAVKYLTPKEAKIVTVCGTGVQGKVQLEAISQVRKIEKAFYYDLDFKQAKQTAVIMQEKLGFEVAAIETPKEGTIESDIIVTCTPSRKAFLQKYMVKESVFIAAVGTDSPGKQEVDPDLIASAQIVADLKEQVVQVGELQYQSEDVIQEIFKGELHEFIAGKKEKPARNKPIIFDSTGTALQDIASAVLVWKNVNKFNI